jgi:hypothetical protein
VAEVEALGYGTIWVGGSPPGDLAFVEHLLDTTQHIAVATSTAIPCPRCARWPASSS